MPITTNSPSLANQFRAQNIFLQDLIDDYSSNNTKSDYILEQNDQMEYINSYLYYVYYIFAISFCAILFISIKIGIPIYKKILITFFLLSIPFFIVRLETYLYSVFVYIRDVIYGNVYLQSDY